LIAVSGFAIHYASAEQVPTWIKNNAGYWAAGSIGDDEFVKGIQYMLQNGIIQIPTQSVASTQSTDQKIPSWVKNNAGYWAAGSIGDDEFVKGIQYMIGARILSVNTSTTSDQNSPPVVNTSTQNSTDTSSCDKLETAADKETCLENIAAEQKMKTDMANSKSYTFGPVTYWLVGTDAVNTGEGVMITVHTIISNTGSQNQNPDLFCTGPTACNYHLTDGEKDFSPSIYSLTSGHLELVYHSPHAIDWNFYTESPLFGWKYDPSKQYSFKVDEPFGKGLMPLKYTLQ